MPLRTFHDITSHVFHYFFFFFYAFDAYGATHAMMPMPHFDTFTPRFLWTSGATPIFYAPCLTAPDEATLPRKIIFFRRAMRASAMRDAPPCQPDAMMMPFTLLFFDAPRAQIRDDFVRDSLRV
jgi:hypothetical protein